MPASSLSGGQRQMVAIGRALMTNPRILLCDENSPGLAPGILSRIYRCLDGICASGLSIVVIEQNVRQAVAAAQYAYCLPEGKVSLEGPTATLHLWMRHTVTGRIIRATADDYQVVQLSGVNCSRVQGIAMGLALSAVAGALLAMRGSFTPYSGADRLLIALPHLAAEGNLRLMVENFCVFAIAQSWNFLAGHVGLMPFGKQLFIGLGAYFVFVVSNRTGRDPFWLAPLGRQATPGEVAPIYVYLLSDESAFRTAQAFSFDGGAYN